jgi:hypothetical protein
MYQPQNAQQGYQPRQFMDFYGGGVQLPFNNQFQQYTQSMFSQPLYSNPQWAQPPTPRQNFQNPSLQSAGFAGFGQQPQGGTKQGNAMPMQQPQPTQQAAGGTKAPATNPVAPTNPLMAPTRGINQMPIKLATEQDQQLTGGPAGGFAPDRDVSMI